MTFEEIRKAVDPNVNPLVIKTAGAIIGTVLVTVIGLVVLGQLEVYDKTEEAFVDLDLETPAE